MHAQKVDEYEKFLRAEESNQTLIIQAVEEPFLETLKEDYIGYGRRISFEMLEYLQTKISKFTNKDKVQLKKQVFIKWEQTQVFTAYFKQIDKAHKQCTKWNVTVSDDDIVIHAIDQMYESDLFLEETMMTWEEIPDNNKSLARCQHFLRRLILLASNTWMQRVENRSRPI